MHSSRELPPASVLASSIVAPVHVRRLDVPVARVARLTPLERFAYYMLGHFFNELMFVQKLLHFTLPRHNDNRPVRQLPEYGQLMFVARLATGKLWEAKVAIERKEFSQALHESFIPLLPGGEDPFKPWKKRLARAKWPADLRDTHSFHYPTFQQWANLLTPDATWEDDQIFLAKESGNVYYAASEAIAHHWMFGQLNSTDPKNAVDPMVTELISLLGEFNSVVEETLGAFVSHLLDGKVQPEADAGTVDAALFEGVFVPFWTNMPQRDPAG
jgi:hypothetical protein